MSLVRLLTTGKSLIGLNGDAVRYEMRSRNLLPKFVSPKNPFARAAVPPVKQAPAVASKMSRAEIAAANLKETKRLPIVAPMKPNQNEVKAPAQSRQWLQMLNFLAWWAERKAARKSARPRFGSAPVQAELSLDKIKVVRNDLNETDVEVVPVKTTVVNARVATAKAASEPEPQPAIPDLPPPTQSWEFVGERTMAK